MKNWLVITVDCDLRSDTVETRQETLDLLLGIFEDTGAAGHTTWFLNENQFFVTECHQRFLGEAVGRGDTIGVHDHVDFLSGNHREAAVRTYFERSRRAVQAWLSANGRPEPVIHHRMGCLYQREACYRALASLGYEVISDAYPGRTMPGHAGDVAFDNCDMPAGCMPFRHDEGNFTDCRSQTGTFLNFPVFHMFLRDLDFGKLEEWIAVGQRDGRDVMPFVWCFHPYELCHREPDGARNVIDRGEVDGLRENIRRFTEEYGLRPANLQACAETFGG